MRYFILSATFAGLIAAAPAALAQDMMGPEDEPKQEEGAQDDKKAKKAAKKAAKQAGKERKRRRGMDVDRYVKQLTETLSLNEEQAGQLRTILTDSVASAEQIRSDAEAKNKELEASRDKQIRELLTDEQTAEYEELTSERDERRKQRAERMRGGDRGAGGQAGGRPRGGGGLLGFDPRAVIGELGLDENQQAQARDIMRSVMGGMREKIGAARQQGPEAMQAAVAEIRESVKEQFSAILDEDQRAKFNELTANAAPGAKAGRAGKERKQKNKRERRPSSPEERMERRLQNVLQAMNLTEDEVMILEPQIKRILQLDADTGVTAEAERKALEELLQADGAVDGDAVRARMESLRKVREGRQTQREELETELRELVTIKQEGLLFLHRVLR